MTDPLAEQEDAAVAQARRNVNKALGLPDVPPAKGISPLFEELWERYAQAPRCDHLTSRPVQPWYLALPWAAWRCGRCTGAFSAANRGKSLGYVEESTCDRCRRYISGELMPTIVRQDMFVIVMSVCSRCFAYAIECGGRDIAPGSARDPGQP